VGLSSLLAWRYVRQRRHWTAARLDLTHDLVECMLGHRTRLAQEAPAHWHDGEDQALARYVELSRDLDRTAAWLLTLVPRGWFAPGTARLCPSLSHRPRRAGRPGHEPGRHPAGL
jgi:ATP-binding cassette subfamily B protein